LSAVPSVEPRTVVRPYIALVRAEIICPSHEWSGGLAVYYDPGSVSFGTWQTLSYCFLQGGSRADDPIVWSRDDVSLNAPLTNRALSLVDRVRHRLDANLPLDWPGRIPPSMRSIVETLYRLHYFEPEHNYVTAMLTLAQAGRTLTPKQIATVQQIKDERGDIEALRRRQHTQWRLRKLAALDLTSDDRRTIGVWTRQAQSPAGLPMGQLWRIGKVEERYLEPRLEATRQRARQIMAEL
jgi:hypothetical protein